MKARVIILIWHMLFNCWSVRDLLPLRKVDQLFKKFILEELESSGKKNGMVSEWGEISSAVPVDISSE